MMYAVVMIIGLFAFIVMIACALEGVIENDDNSIKISMVSCVVVIICLVSIFLAFHNIKKQTWEVDNQPYNVEYISALKDSGQVSGRFYLRSGYIDEQLYYQYISRQSDGGYTTNRVKASDAVIYYTNGNYRIEWRNKTRHWFLFEDKSIDIKIYVPHGSVTSEYNIDLE